MALRFLSARKLFQNNDRFVIQRLNKNTRMYEARLTRLQSTSPISTNVKYGWREWRGIVTRFVPVGLCLLAVMQWRSYRKFSSQHIANQWEIKLYCSLPLRALSRSWGWIAEKQLPEFVRPWVYGLYASSFSVDLNEAVSCDFKYYASLADFFSRSLKDGVRTVDAESCLTSPCDGTVLHFGTVNSCTVEQVKGVTYSLEQFLTGKKDDGKNGEEYRQSLLLHPEEKPTTLYQCILYLAPGDYHRFHSPADWKPEKRRHYTGELLSVNPGMARWIPGLFALNERAVYTGQWQHGFFSFTPVGATNVGSVKVYFDKSLHTNTHKPMKRDWVSLSPDVRLGKGDLIGEFRMGSTIVLIFEAPCNFEFNLSMGQTVRMGQGIGCVKKAKHVDKVQKRTFNVMTSAA